MKPYEFVVIARQDLSPQDAHKLSEKLAKLLTDMGGEVVKKESWGLRSLAYEIKKNKKGHYIMIGARASHDAVLEFERQSKISEDIIRCAVFGVEELTEQPSIMMQAPVKTVVGASATVFEEVI